MKPGVTPTAKSEGTGLHKTVHTPDTDRKFRVPPNTLRFDNSLEGLIELTENYYTHRYRIRIPVKRIRISFFLTGKDTSQK